MCMRRAQLPRGKRNGRGALVGAFDGETDELAVALVPELDEGDALAHDVLGSAKVVGCALLHVVQNLGRHLHRDLVVHRRQIVQSGRQRFLEHRPTCVCVSSG